MAGSGFAMPIVVESTIAERAAGAARLELADTEVSARSTAVPSLFDTIATGRTVLIRWKAAMLASSGYRHTLCRPLPSGGPRPHLDRPIEIGATDADTTECLAVVVRPDVEIVLRNRLRREQLGDAADAGVVSVGGEFGGDLELEPPRRRISETTVGSGTMKTPPMSNTTASMCSGKTMDRSRAHPPPPRLPRLQR